MKILFSKQAIDKKETKMKRDMFILTLIFFVTIYIVMAEVQKKGILFASLTDSNEKTVLSDQSPASNSSPSASKHSSAVSSPINPAGKKTAAGKDFVLVPPNGSPDKPGINEKSPNRESAIYFAYRSFNPELETTQKMGELGVDTVCVFPSNIINSLREPYCGYGPTWLEETEYDFKPFDRQINDLIKANPKAKFICMIDLNTPAWMTRMIGLDSYLYISHAACRGNYLRLVKGYLTAFLEHSESHYSDKIAAYILSGGASSEWFDNNDNLRSRWKDKSWQKWLNDNKLPFRASCPSMFALEQASLDNFIYDPVEDVSKILYQRFHSQVITSAILDLAHLAKEKTDWKKEIGVFYGYYFLQHGRSNMFGHMDYERLAASREIDFLLSPAAYSHQDIGEGSGSQLLHGTILRYGKKFIHEIDHRSNTSPYPYKREARWPSKEFNEVWEEVENKHGPLSEHWKTQEDTNAGYKREVAFAMINHTSLWLFDMWGGNFQTKDSLHLVKRLREIFTKYEKDRSPSAAQVVYIADPQSSCYINDSDHKAVASTSQIRDNLNFLGAPYDVYSFNDIDNIDFAKYKLVILPRMFFIDKKREEILNKYVLTGGKTVLWLYAPGITDGRKLDPAAVKKWTGFDFKTPGINYENFENWTSVYMPEYEMATPENLKQIAAKAGVVIYCQDKVPVYANEKLTAVHVKDGGKKKITLPKKCRKIADVWTGKTIAENTNSFEYDFQSPDTVIFETDY